MPQSLDRHLKYCPLTSKGYTKNEIVSVGVFKERYIVRLYVGVCLLMNSVSVSEKLRLCFDV